MDSHFYSKSNETAWQQNINEAVLNIITIGEHSKCVLQVFFQPLLQIIDMERLLNKAVSGFS